MTAERDIKCPRCQLVNELHAGPDPAAVPSAGDISVCWSPDVQAVMAAMRSSRTPSEANERRWRA